jgi:hypothetical protein
MIPGNPGPTIGPGTGSGHNATSRGVTSAARSSKRRQCHSRMCRPSAVQYRSTRRSKVRFRCNRELIAGAVAEGARQQDAVILADACAGAARRIMTELLAQSAGVPRGRA